MDKKQNFFVTAICGSSVLFVLLWKCFVGETVVTGQYGTGQQRNDSRTNCIVLTTFLSINKDPQRDIHVPTNLKYMFNFYTTAKYHSLPVKVFHDNLTLAFVTKYQTPSITFEKVVKAATAACKDVTVASHQRHSLLHRQIGLLPSQYPHQTKNTMTHAMKAAHQEMMMIGLGLIAASRMSPFVENPESLALTVKSMAYEAQMVA